ncbi:MAG: DUF6291 domain-containing protein [Muribaculum sp.]|nr:DUF6291 domain-containing protein [Muribaculaceae bacterium]MCM1080924.1 DUF6291 domain-containing protein [Muribaculum sp.]
MARKHKFDSEWESALALLDEYDAAEARKAIENYQICGEMPAELAPQVRMILLLVKPEIDRRRRASEAARRRRANAKMQFNSVRQEVQGAEQEKIAEPQLVAVTTAKAPICSGASGLSTTQRLMRSALRHRKKHRCQSSR